MPQISKILVLLLLAHVGCGRTPEFADNKVFVKRLELEIGGPLPEQGLADIRLVLNALFGSADQPLLPSNFSERALPMQPVTLENLHRAAGRVFSDENDVHFGLYRNNCIRCHGTSGDGRGPAARLLSPYPRDFRLGKFKFKSTAQGVKPSKSDLIRTIRHGIPGTSMPSFALLSDQDIEALAEYVIYLSVRGETERELLRELANSLDYSRGDRIFDANWQETDPNQYQSKLGELANLATGFLRKWQVEPSPRPLRPTAFSIGKNSSANPMVRDSGISDSVARGERLFRSELASCSKCHGEDGTGRSAPKDYDLWTKDWTLAVGIDPEDRDAIGPLLKVGALKPVLMYPRNLRYGAFRGGGEPEEIYLRIIHGIEGTSMPAAALQPLVSEGLTSDQVWDLVNYVLSLADEAAVPVESQITHKTGGAP